jgi:DNA-directed RNA polymerase specialized sigma24 family protein
MEMIADLNLIMPLAAEDRTGAPGRARSVEEPGWSGRCRTTRWSVVFAAAAGGASARVALSRLYRAYWYPVFALVAQARGREAAAELTQEFFVTRLVDRGDLRLVSRRPGERFRSWLFTALRSFLKNQWKYERQQCRDVRLTVAILGDTESNEPGPRVSALADANPDPEQRLDRQQALTLLANVLARLRREYCANASTAGVDGELRFDAVKVFLPGRDTEAADYREVARSLGLATDAVRQMVCRLRARFGYLLHDALAKGEWGDGDVATAKRLLCAALSGCAPSPSAAFQRADV